MAIAGDEAGIKASYSRNFSYLVLVVIGTFLIIFFLVITIWWLIVSKDTTQNLVHKQVS